MKKSVSLVALRRSECVFYDLFQHMQKKLFLVVFLNSSDRDESVAPASPGRLDFFRL